MLWVALGCFGASVSAQAAPAVAESRPWADTNRDGLSETLRAVYDAENRPNLGPIFELLTEGQTEPFALLGHNPRNAFGFGSSWCMGPDVDADGIPDLFVCSPLEIVDANRRGRVYVFSKRYMGVYSEFTGDIGETFGVAIAGVTPDTSGVPTELQVITHRQDSAGNVWRRYTVLNAVGVRLQTSSPEASELVLFNGDINDDGVIDAFDVQAVVDVVNSQTPENPGENAPPLRNTHEEGNYGSIFDTDRDGIMTSNDIELPSKSIGQTTPTSAGFDESSFLDSAPVHGLTQEYTGSRSDARTVDPFLVVPGMTYNPITRCWEGISPLGRWARNCLSYVRFQLLGTGSGSGGGGGGGGGSGGSGSGGGGAGGAQNACEAVLRRNPLTHVPGPETNPVMLLPGDVERVSVNIIKQPDGDVKYYVVSTDSSVAPISTHEDWNFVGPTGQPANTPTNERVRFEDSVQVGGSQSVFVFGRKPGTCRIELRVDSPSGPLCASIEVRVGGRYRVEVDKPVLFEPHVEGQVLSDGTVSGLGGWLAQHSRRDSTHKLPASEPRSAESNGGDTELPLLNPPIIERLPIRHRAGRMGVTHAFAVAANKVKVRPTALRIIVQDRDGGR